MSPNQELIKPRGWLDQQSRQLTDSLIQMMYHTEIIGTIDGLGRAIDLNTQGYGIIFMYNHFSEYEGPVLAGQILRVPEFRLHSSVFPIGLHQYDKHKRMLHLVSTLARGNLVPIATEDTIKLPEYQQKGVKLGEGTPLYFRLAAESLISGGTVGVAPQGRRDRYMDTSVIPIAIGSLVSNVLHQGMDRIAFIAVGMDLKDIPRPADYRMYHDIKMGEYIPTVHFGRCITLQELGYNQSMSNNLKEKISFLRDLSVWSFYEVGSAVHKDYLQPGFDISNQPLLKQSNLS